MSLKYSFFKSMFWILGYLLVWKICQPVSRGEVMKRSVIAHAVLILPCILFQREVSFIKKKRDESMKALMKGNNTHSIYLSTDGVCERAFLRRDLWQEPLQLNCHWAIVPDNGFDLSKNGFSQWPTNVIDPYVAVNSKICCHVVRKTMRRTP